MHKIALKERILTLILHVLLKKSQKYLELIQNMIIFAAKIYYKDFS
jgi:hypothetical protein